MELGHMLVSEGLYEDVRAAPSVAAVGAAEPFRFDPAGQIISPEGIEAAA